jgi:aminoglycoside 6'-N-acetyltransferase
LGLIRPHSVTLRDGPLVLRPLTEDDWEILAKWGRDSEVLYFTEGDKVESYTLKEIQGIYRSVAQNAFCFLAELDGLPIGEGWLQKMNIPAISERHPGKNLRRIDLSIGEKSLWGKGWGSRMITLLTRFGFEQENADAIYGLVEGHNPRSRRAFEKAGYVLEREEPQPPGGKSTVGWELVLTRERWRAGSGGE